MINNIKQEKCPIQTCKVRMEHYHEESSFRSRVTPWWKKNQNPQIGQDWKNNEDIGDEKASYKSKSSKKKE